MASTYQLLVDGTPVEAGLYEALGSIEVEENAELPGAIQLNLPVNRDEAGDLAYVSDPLFKPYANLAVVVEVEDRPAECIFDGYVLSHKLHLQRGTVASTLQVWGQDASWLMNLEEKAREWVDVTDAAVASAIFGEYGIQPAPDNDADDSATHTESGHTLMQRATDIQFLRQLARRGGKLCRVVCTQQAGQRTGYFARPDLSAEPAVVLPLNDPEQELVTALDFEWDVSRPSEVTTRQALFQDPSEDGVSGDTADSGLEPLDERGLASFAGRPMKVMLTASVDDAGELQQRARALLRESGFFARCTGEVDVAALKAVLRVGTVVQIEGAGSLHSGKYLVWSVRHTLTADSHRMGFVLVRNAVGPQPSGGGGGGLF
ncbi:phage late control D family protein [Archangium lansingense]|uniref:Contractile injection system protein, VgrG/Pvc8 family n=1 Tax=Archangium lansingense TaxID=2995310 RepID=A0ABT4AAL7_9BACT|nr:contractile injection system protein, VgrG/Pvc8 family [Archangium lansinium]MCY1078702.1 contractile injection system protein, VgrG/Pvc8 family [Archangium lansinium]